jgi:hypothetical protein
LELMVSTPYVQPVSYPLWHIIKQVEGHPLALSSCVGRSSRGFLNLTAAVVVFLQIIASRREECAPN